MNPLDLIAVILASFYLAYAISSTHGPFHVFEWVRVHLPLGGLTSCIVCLSVWCAGLFYVLLLTALAPIVWIVAAGGAAVLLYRYTGGSHVD